MDRKKEIVKVSIHGILANLLLVMFKTAVGFMANSIAVMLDALNNLSDALSSVITIVGTKLAGKLPDKEHPYGYGRIEYITSVVIAVIVLLAGLASLKESVEKIWEPAELNYTWISVLIIVVGIAGKMFLGKYVSRRGEELHSQSLIASGADAGFDAMISVATLISALLSMFMGWNLEGILGAVISLVIIKAGGEILKETLDSIIGTRVESELAHKVKSRITAIGGVKGAYDLVLHNYGPEDRIGSVHIEVDDRMTAREIQILTRKILFIIQEEFGIVMTVGIYASNTDTPEALSIKNELRHILKAYPNILQLHGFYVNEEEVFVNFDLVFGFDEKDRFRVCREIEGRMKERFPKYNFLAIEDVDFSD